MQKKKWLVTDNIDDLSRNARRRLGVINRSSGISTSNDDLMNFNLTRADASISPDHPPSKVDSGINVNPHDVQMCENYVIDVKSMLRNEVLKFL